MSDRRSKPQDRRSFIKYAGTAGAVTLAGCLGGDSGDEENREDSSDSSDEMVDMHTIIAEGGADSLVYFMGEEEGVWRERGINLSIEVAPFEKFDRQIVDGFAEIGAPAIPGTINFVNEGEDLTAVGSALGAIQPMLAREDDDELNEPQDLSDKILGIPPEVSSASVMYRGMFLDEFSFDILEDTGETRTAPPPSLWDLLKQGEIDAAIPFTGIALTAITSGVTKTIFDPMEYWHDRTGYYPPTTWVVTRQSFLDENEDLTRQWLEALSEASTLTAENADRAVQNYGRRAGVEEDDEAELLEEWTAEELLFSSDPAFTEDEVENNIWPFLELMSRGYDFGDFPEQDEIITVL